VLSALLFTVTSFLFCARSFFSLPFSYPFPVCLLPAHISFFLLFLFQLCILFHFHLSFLFPCSSIAFPDFLSFTFSSSFFFSLLFPCLPITYPHVLSFPFFPRSIFFFLLSFLSFRHCLVPPGARVSGGADPISAVQLGRCQIAQVYAPPLEEDVQWGGGWGVGWDMNGTRATGKIPVPPPIPHPLPSLSSLFADVAKELERKKLNQFLVQKRSIRHKV
jgi:hypothetical protein